MEKRGAVGLTINTLVIVIISLVILSSGVTLLYKFIGGAQQVQRDLDQRTANELERLLVDQGKMVALPLQSATVFRGETHVFGIGILNIRSDLDQFQITVVYSEGFNQQNELIPNVDLDEWLLYNEETLLIEENEHKKEGILVSVPKNAESGRYIFVATVTTPDEGNDRYGNPQTFFVTVN